MKTTIGILCIVVPIVAAYWDIIGPAVKKAVQRCKIKSAKIRYTIK